MQNHYSVLGVTQTATEEEIRKAYRKLSLKYHPDKTSDKQHHELFIKIGQAYEVLKTPETRNKYDLESGVSTTRSPQRPSGDNFYTTGTAYYTSSSTTSSSSHRFGGSYYGFYLQMYGRREPDIRQAQQERERAEDLLKREMLNRLRREEALRRAQEQAAELMRRTMERRRQERELDDRIERELREKETRYREEKRHAQVRAYAQHAAQYTTDPLDQQYRKSNVGTDTNPIVLDDDNDSVEETFYSVHSDSERDEEGNVHEEAEQDEDEQEMAEQEDGQPESEQPAEEQPEPSLKQEAQPELGSESNIHNKLNDLLNMGPNIRPRQEPSRLFNRRSVSPRRAPQQKTSFIRETSPIRHKRMKTNGFSMGDLDESLGSGDIEDVDFSDMYKNLPDDDTKGRRKISETASPVQNKRPKVHEYYDGTSKAETLHTPINKKSVKGHAVVSLRDLLPITTHDVIPPREPTGTSAGEWSQYQKLFMNYKKSILEYKFDRIKRDEKFVDDINADFSNLEVYHRCLEHDLEIELGYLELLRTYNKYVDKMKNGNV